MEGEETARMPNVAEGFSKDITVTAEKRAQRLQDVPLAVNVATDAQLKAAGIQNVEALGATIPSLNITRPTAGAFIPSIRGVTAVTTLVMNAGSNTQSRKGELRATRMIMAHGCNQVLGRMDDVQHPGTPNRIGRMG